ncbi:MAG: hypothetical protein A2381_15945 [Bdellovibrionales bacterium RIFOXYB1_FULL_37_110]|nr:MAG: hypothetical protein A2381_15945 [Bdellovibrionales bacterium RIFOXYB1_FULL_37_110]
MIILLGLCLIFISGNVFSLKSQIAEPFPDSYAGNEQTQVLNNTYLKNAKKNVMPYKGLDPWLDELYFLHAKADEVAKTTLPVDANLFNGKKILYFEAKTTPLTHHTKTLGTLKILGEELPTSNISAGKKNPDLTSITTVELPPNQMVILHGNKSLLLEKINDYFVPIKAKEVTRDLGDLQHYWLDRFDLKKCRRLYEIVKDQNDIGTSILKTENIKRIQKALSVVDSEHKKLKDLHTYQNPKATYRDDNPSDNAPIDALQSFATTMDTLKQCDNYGLSDLYKDDKLWKDYELYPKFSTPQAPAIEKESESVGAT